MKKLLVSVFSVSLCLGGIAQTNNPYNEKGIEIDNNINTLTNDYKAGKIKDYSLETIAKYANQFSMDEQNAQSEIPSLYATVTDKNYDPQTAIRNSTASDYMKTEALNIIIIVKNSTVPIETSLYQKVEQIKASKATDEEKQTLLTICAAIYNFDLSAHNQTGTLNRNIPAATAGTAIGMIVGGIIGNTFCGPVCGFIGSVVIGFIGNIIGGKS